MKKLLEFLVSSIVSQPKKVTVEEMTENDGVTLIIHAADDDLKIIIGKKGRTIKALREILRIKALNQNKRINIKVAE